MRTLIALFAFLLCFSACTSQAERQAQEAKKAEMQKDIDRRTVVNDFRLNKDARLQSVQALIDQKNYQGAIDKAASYQRDAEGAVLSEIEPYKGLFGDGLPTLLALVEDARSKKTAEENAVKAAKEKADLEAKEAQIKAEKESKVNSLLAYVKTLPEGAYDGMLSAYQQLATLNPENKAYAEKVQELIPKAEELKEKKKAEERQEKETQGYLAIQRKNIADQEAWAKDHPISVEFESGYNQYNVSSVVGIAKNNTRKKFSSVWIDFNLYDSQGSLVENTSAFIDDLEPLGTWKFTASIYNNSVTTIKLKSIKYE